MAMPDRQVADTIKSTTLTTVKAGATVRDAVKCMAERNIGAVLVTDDKKLLGIFTERDLAVRAIAPEIDIDSTRVDQVMTRDPDTLKPQDSVYDALKMMQENSYRHLPVLDGGQIVGMVSIRDIYGVVKEQLEEDVQSCEAFVFGSGYGG
jgi:CBS domain-containing protein